MYESKVTPTQYFRNGKVNEVPDKTGTLCPQCKSDFLRKHGFYSRYLITVGFEGTILIRRYYCRVCKKTVSLLPSFCHPKRTYSTVAVIGVLSEFYVKMKAACAAAGNYLITSGVECSRQLLLHYRKRIEKNLNCLIMAVTEIYSLRDPPVTEKTNTRKRVRQLLSNIPLPEDASLKIFKRTRATYLTPQPL